MAILGYNSNMLTREGIINELKQSDDGLFNQADAVRRECVGDEVHLRGLIEFSNICKCSCHYCGLRAQNASVNRYQYTKDEILNFAKQGKNLGLQTIVLQSGENNYELCKIIEELKKLDVAITLSVGEKTFDEYKSYRNAGADRYLLRIETTDIELYKKLHPNMSFDNRMECLFNLKSLGFETGTGSLVGLPEQTIESLADDILFFKELDADMIGIGPFIPHPNTPLGDSRVDLVSNFWLSLRVMALTRILLRNINIPATTAMETIHPNGRVLALQSGANVVMPNIAEGKDYEIYPNKNRDELESIKTKIQSIGRTIGKGKGFRNKSYGTGS